jgi:hypothetical protein
MNKNKFNKLREFSSFKKQKIYEGRESNSNSNNLTDNENNFYKNVFMDNKVKP